MSREGDLLCSRPQAGGINGQMTLMLSTTGAIHDPRCPPLVLLGKVPETVVNECPKSFERVLISSYFPTMTDARGRIRLSYEHTPFEAVNEHAGVRG